MLKIFKSLFVVVAVAAIAGGATFALWNDEAKVQGITVSSGNMDLKVDQDANDDKDWVDGFDIMSYEFRRANDWTLTERNEFLEQIGLVDLYPGETGGQSIGVLNKGDVDGMLTIKIKKISGYESLADNLRFKLSYNDEVKKTGTLTNINDKVYNLGILEVGEDHEGDVDIEWEMLSSAGNETQNKDVSMEITFDLVQQNN